MSPFSVSLLAASAVAALTTLALVVVAGISDPSCCALTGEIEILERTESSADGQAYWARFKRSSSLAGRTVPIWLDASLRPEGPRYPRWEGDLRPGQRLFVVLEARSKCSYKVKHFWLDGVSRGPLAGSYAGGGKVPEGVFSPRLTHH